VATKRVGDQAISQSMESLAGRIAVTIWKVKILLGLLSLWVILALRGKIDSSGQPVPAGLT
jgi:hypothetical protein